MSSGRKGGGTSRALDAADPETCQRAPISGLDQRGAARDGTAGCDVGAYEAVPLLTTSVSAAAVVGGSVSDTARLAGDLSPTGTLIFKLYGPDDANCGGAPVFASGPVPLDRELLRRSRQRPRRGRLQRSRRDRHGPRPEALDAAVHAVQAV